MFFFNLWTSTHKVACFGHRDTLCSLTFHAAFFLVAVLLYGTGLWQEKSCPAPVALSTYGFTGGPPDQHIVAHRCRDVPRRPNILGRVCACHRTRCVKVQQSSAWPAWQPAHGESPDVSETVLAPCGTCPRKASQYVRSYALCVCVLVGMCQ